jgi:hypothetical protein
MTKKQIDDAFKRFFDPQAAKKGAKEVQIKTLGGHGNGIAECRRGIAATGIRR